MRITDAAARRIVLLGGLLLAALYLWSYVGNPARPGNDPVYPPGWWNWFDQSMSLKSAQAFAAGDLRAEKHWYPLGYALLGAPFVRVLPLHPFVVVGLLCVLAAYAGFVAFARRVGVPPLWSVPLFLLSAGADPLLFQQWVIPWNTTPAAALVWLLLAATAAQLDGAGRPFLIGLLAGLVPTMRPTELLVIAPCALAAGVSILFGPARRRLRGLGLAILGGALPILAYLALHVAIYGMRPSDYMTGSQDIGFTAYALGWKAYVLLVEPRVWFGGGEGLLRRVPWMALGIAGLPAALLAGRARALLAAVLLVHALLYLSYVDLLPSGFWRFNLTHYWVWTLPGYALLGLLLLRDLLRPAAPGRRVVAAGALAVVAVLLCLHLNPVPAVAREAFAVDFYGPAPTREDGYFRRWSLRDAAGEQTNIYGVRGQAMPMPPTGLRVFSIRRPFAGDERLVPDDTGFPAGPLLGPPARRWSIGLRFGRPCWLIGCDIPAANRMFGE
jgi:hypothetical protein